MLFSYFQF